MDWALFGVMDTLRPWAMWRFRAEVRAPPPMMSPPMWRSLPRSVERETLRA